MNEINKNLQKKMKNILFNINNICFFERLRIISCKRMGNIFEIVLLFNYRYDRIKLQGKKFNISIYKETLGEKSFFINIDKKE